MFDTLLKKESDDMLFSKKKTIFDTKSHIDKSNWFEVYSVCFGKVAAMQTACEEQIVEGNKWSADLSRGTITFGSQEYPVQVIGSEGIRTNSWQWEYKNINNLSPKVLKLAHEAEKFGIKWNLAPLVVPDIELDEVFNGENFSIVACGISKENYCYFPAPTEKGTVYLAFSELPESIYSSLDVNRFAQIAAYCLQEYHVEHRIFVESFLIWNGTDYDFDGDDIIAYFDQDTRIRFVYERVEEFWRVREIHSF